MFRKSLLLTSGLLFFGCVQQPQVATQKVEQPPCTMDQGEYTVQSAVYYKKSNEYELVLLGAPGCLAQPAKMTGLSMNRLEEGHKEQAVLNMEAAKILDT